MQTHIQISQDCLYFPQKLLGQGNFSPVYEGLYKGEQVAVKILKNTKESEKYYHQEIINCKKILQQSQQTSQNPNLVQIHSIIQPED